MRAGAQGALMVHGSSTLMLSYSGARAANRAHRTSWGLILQRIRQQCVLHWLVASSSIHNKHSNDTFATHLSV